MGYSGKSQLANWRPGRGQTSGLSQEARASLHQASCHGGLGGRGLGLLASDSRALKRERRGGAGHSLTHKHKSTTNETIAATLPRAQQTYLFTRTQWSFLSEAKIAEDFFQYRM